MTARRIYFDCEFMEDGKTIDLLSLGAVRSDGGEFYGLNTEADVRKANEFVVQHVLPELRRPLDDPPLFRVAAPRQFLAQEFERFVLEGKGDKPVEFWGYYCDYDWVCMCQLYGRMVDLPKGFPYFAYDLRQFFNHLGLSDFKQPADAPHHALLDARWCANVHRNYPRPV